MCKRMCCLLFGLLLVCSVARAQEEAAGGGGALSAWRTFNAPEGDFSVDFPGVPQPRTEQTSRPGWTLTRHYYELVVDSSRYVVGYVETAPGSTSPEQRLNAGLKRMIDWYAAKGGTEVGRHEVSVSPSCRMLDWQGISPVPGAPALLVLRMAATPGRSYFLMFASNRAGNSMTDYYKRFVESFKVASHQCAAELTFPTRPYPADGRQTFPIGPGRSGNRGGGDALEGGGGLRPRPNPRDGIYKSTEVTKRAVFLSKPQPQYTAKARMNGTYGTVRLRAVLRNTGDVTDIYIVNGLPDGLNDSAIAAARRIKFAPAEYEGRKVSQWALIEYNFNLY